MKSSIALSALVAASSFTTVVLAQESQNSDLAQENQNSDLNGASDIAIEEILITARKRGESITEIPDAIVALTSEVIENAGVQNIEDVSMLVPNFSFSDTQNAGTSFINIRGVGQFRNGEPPVAIVVDGVQLVSTDAITQELFDIQQIEVLKGPQGALFGRNAAGGAINIVTKKPTNEFEGLVEAGYGNGEDIRGRAMFSGPLVEDKVFARLAASVRDYGGLIQNAVVAEDKIDHLTDRNIRGRLLIEASDRLSLDFRASYSKLDSGASGYVATFDENGLVVDGSANDFSFPVSEDTVGKGERELQEYAAKIDYDLGFATLTSVSAYSRTSEFYLQDLDFSSAPVLEFSQDRKVKAFSEELRLTSNGDGPLQWSAGVYYLDSERELDTRVFASANAGLYFSPDFFSGVIGLNDLDPSAEFGPLVTNITLESNTAWAVFGNATYDVSDKLALIVGLRYDEDKRKITDLQGVEAEKQKTFDLLQPKIQLTYEATEEVNLYASWGKGFRSGGFNPTPVVRDRFEAEEVSTYEVGFKSNWMDNRVTLNGAVFYSDFVNRQDFIFVLGNQAILTFPESKLFGGELELRANISDDLEIFASLGLIDTELQSEIVGFDPAIANLPADTTFTGNKFGLVYGWSYALGVQYTKDLDALDATFIGRVDYSANGDLEWQFDNRDQQDAVHLVNVRAALDFENYKITAWVENLTDVTYYTEYFPAEFSGEAADTGYPAQPRRYGLTVTARF